METKHLGGKITDFKQIDRNGIPVGIVEGYIATWDIDRGNDRFKPGAFTEHLKELRAKNRGPRLKDNHGRTVGIFPIENVKEDSRGLFGIGEINLEVQQGRELYSLVKQKAMTDFSIGYSVQDVEYINGIREIIKSRVWEGSVVDEPMNPEANITDVKSIGDRSELPKGFFDLDYRWEPEQALKRIDGKEDQSFLNDKIHICDIHKGVLKIVPRAVFAARLQLTKEKGFDQEKEIINCLYKEMGLEPPFKDGKVKSFCLTEIKNLTKSDFRDILQNQKLSRDASKYLTSICYPVIMGEQSGENGTEVLTEILHDLKNIRGNL